MNKFIIFLSILLTLLAGFLIYLIADPYIKNIKKSYMNVSDGEVHGNFITPVNENELNNSNNQENSITNENPENNLVRNDLAEIASKMTKEELDMYNISFTGYAGENMNGQMVKVLLEAIYVSNANHIGVEGKFVAVTQDYNKDIETTIGKPGDKKNKEDVVKKSNDKLYDLRDATDSEENFNIECIYYSVIVVVVKITKVK